ncbi:NUDIX domain-containing protein [Alloscardovia venturai]|uniref:NUDIX domain-containing protein n=1 Tax=Alloscardovia venturai TaxID=1769421 RepID=A0ABW2Y375_9BIFI
MKNISISANPMEVPSRFLHTYNIDVALDNGKKNVYTIATRNVVKCLEDLPRETGDAVAVIVRSVGDDQMLVIRQYRPAVNGYIWEFPAGLIDPDDTSFEAAALRELKEETGYDAVSVDEIIPPTYTSAGFSNESVAFVYVTADPLQEDAQQQLEETEDITIRWVNRKEAAALIRGEEGVLDQRCALALREFVREK